MDMLRDNTKKLYFKYLSAAFGSALISSIYAVVDMAAVGQYQGPDGTAALAVIAPVWNIIYSLGLLMGVGGSVLLGLARGQGQKKRQNEYFTTSVIGSAVLAALVWIAVGVFDTQLLRLFGADEGILVLAKTYLKPVKLAVPLFLLNQMLAAFLRNDNAPALATAGILAGGIFNIFGDIFFVFVLDMGIFGAGLATAIGALISFLILLAHFITKKNTLRLIRPSGFWHKLGQVSLTGVSTFVVDVAMGVLTMLFNRQIMKLFGTNALAVYGVIVNISTVVQCCAYSVGQAAQPIISINYGGERWDRIKEILRYGIISAAVFGVIWTASVWAVPNGFVRIFMAPTAEIYEIAPAILRSYGISFLLLPLNVFATFYFQAIMKPYASLGVSLGRGVLVSGGLILLLPALFVRDAVWFAMPATELITAAVIIVLMVKYTRELKKEK